MSASRTPHNRVTMAAAGPALALRNTPTPCQSVGNFITHRFVSAVRRWLRGRGKTIASILIGKNRSVLYRGAERAGVIY